MGRRAGRAEPSGNDVQFECGLASPPVAGIPVSSIWPAASAAGDLNRLFTPLLGAHQAANAGTAAVTAIVASHRLPGITPAAVRRGLAAVSWPGRLQVIGQKPTVVLDGAHTAESAHALSETMAALFGGKRLILVVGMPIDKDIPATLAPSRRPGRAPPWRPDPDHPRAAPARGGGRRAPRRRFSSGRATRPPLGGGATRQGPGRRRGGSAGDRVVTRGWGGAWRLDGGAIDTMTRGPLVAVGGPTASGKTDLAIGLAKELNGEIVNADSRQVYRHMDIGTAKPTPAQRAMVPHHLLDLVNPDQPFTLGIYVRSAHQAILDIQGRGRLPILVGGTGLYLRAVTRGFVVPEVAPNPELRLRLESDLNNAGLPALVERLRALDPVGAATIDRNNPRRVIRALEVCLETGQPFSSLTGSYDTALPRRRVHSRRAEP